MSRNSAGTVATTFLPRFCFCLAMTAAFLIFVASSRPAQAGETSPLVLVEHLGVNVAVESIKADTGVITGDIKQSLSSSKLGSDPAHENAFLLWPQKAITLEFVTVEGISEQGVPLPGAALAKHKLQKDEAYLFKHHVPEGMPNLLVCVRSQGVTERLCWTPRFSGVDGSPVFDRGFAPFKKK